VDNRGAGGDRLGEQGLSIRWKWPVYLLAAYPIFSYFLHIYPWGILLGEWAKYIFIFLAIMALRGHLSGRRPKFYPMHKMIVYMIVLGLIYVVMDMGYSRVAWAGYEVDFLYMMFALLLPYVMDADDLVPIIKIVVLTGFLMAMHGVYEYIVKVPIPSDWIDISQHVRTRVYSLFYSPNIFGDYVAFVGPMAIGLAFYVRERAQKWFYAICAVLCTATLVFTFTRGAWLAFFVAILVLTWLIDKRLTLLAVVVGVLAILFVHPIHSRIEQFLTPVYWAKTFGPGGRIGRWERAYNQMRLNPLFGAGIGRYGGAVAARFFGIQYVDNYYAATLAELGLVGLISYLAVLFVYLRDVYRAWKRCIDPRMKYLMAGIFSSLIVEVVHNSVENIFEVPDMNMLFWLVGTMLLIYSAGEVNKRAQSLG
jgi:cell division protein FtsW (lipid II flippase)